MKECPDETIPAKTNTPRIKKEGKITSTGYWIPENVEEIPGLKMGSFVRLADGSILTMDDTKCFVSKDEGKTWEKIKNVEDDPDGWYCYIAIHFTDKHVLLGYTAGSSLKGRSWAVLDITD